MALKSADDCGVDDEISSTEIDNLAKNLRNFQRNNNKRERNRNNTNSKNVKKNETTKNTISEKTKDKVVQSSNNSLWKLRFVLKHKSLFRLPIKKYG